MKKKGRKNPRLFSTKSRSSDGGIGVFRSALQRGYVVFVNLDHVLLLSEKPLQVLGRSFAGLSSG
jgi:hypothetical protein